MKTNPTLQKYLGMSKHSQKVWYAAHVLKSALISSPTYTVRAAVPAQLAKPEVIAWGSFPARPASAAVTADANTVGYAFGELYLDSPAYPIGTAIPAIPAKLATAARPGSSAQPAQLAKPAVIAPAVVAIKGWEDAIQITKVSASNLTVTAELPFAQNVGLVGSQAINIIEITPTALQATAWLADAPYDEIDPSDLDDARISTLEQFLYKHAVNCEHTSTNTIRVVNGIPTACKKLVINVYGSNRFDINNKSPQLDYIRDELTAGS